LLCPDGDEEMDVEERSSRGREGRLWDTNYRYKSATKMLRNEWW
jgi:hypothetical protein